MVIYVANNDKNNCFAIFICGGCVDIVALEFRRTQLRKNA